MTMWGFLIASVFSTMCVHGAKLLQSCPTVQPRVARQTPLSMGFSRQEYWSGLPCPPPGDLPDPGIEPMSLTSTCTGRQVLYHCGHLGSPFSTIQVEKSFTQSELEQGLGTGSWWRGSGRETVFSPGNTLSFSGLFTGLVR